MVQDKKQIKTFTAKLKYFRGSPKKISPILERLKNRTAEEAIDHLNFINKGFSKALIKLIKSAMSNAENLGSNKDNLKIKEFICSTGPKLKRFRPGHRGRAYPYTRKLCHINLVLEEVEGKIQLAKKITQNKTKK